MSGSRTIHELRALVSSNVQSFVSGLAQSERATRSLRSTWIDAARAVDSSATRIAAAVGSVVAATSAAITKLGFSYLGMKEQAEVSFTTLLGDGEKARKMFADLVDLAAKTPLQIKGAVGSAQKLLAMGFAAEKILPTLRTIIDTVSALGGSEEVLKRVTTAFGQMLAKGKVSAEEMMQLAEAGIPAWKMLADTIGTDIPTAMKLVEQRAVDSETAIAGILARMDQRFGGMAEKQSRTFQGLWSTIKDLALSGSAAIVEPLFAVVKRQLDQLAVYLQGTGFQAFARGLRGQLLQVIAALELNTARPELAFKRLGAVVSEFASGAVSIIAWLKEAAPGLSQFGRAMWSVIQPIAEFLKAHPQFLAAWAAMKIGQLFGITQALWALGAAIAATTVRLLDMTAAVTGHASGLRLLKSVLLADVTRPLQILDATVLPAVAAAWRRSAAAASAGVSAAGSVVSSWTGLGHAAATAVTATQSVVSSWTGLGQNAKKTASQVLNAWIDFGLASGRTATAISGDTHKMVASWITLGNLIDAVTGRSKQKVDVVASAMQIAATSSQHYTMTAERAAAILSQTLSGRLSAALQSTSMWFRNVVTTGGAQFLRFLREVGASALPSFLSRLRSLGPALGQLATQLAASARGMMTLGNAVRALGWAGAIAGVLGYVNALNEMKKAQVDINAAMAEGDRLTRLQRRQEQEVRGKKLADLQAIENPADRFSATRDTLERAQRELSDQNNAAAALKQKAADAKKASATIYDSAQRGLGFNTDYKFEGEARLATQAEQLAESTADYVSQLKTTLEQASRELEKAGKEGAGAAGETPETMMDRIEREQAAKEAEQEKKRAREEAHRDAARRAEKVESDQYRMGGDLSFAIQDQELTRQQAEQFAAQMQQLGSAFKAGTLSENEYEFSLRVLSRAIDDTTRANQEAARAEEKRKQVIADSQAQFTQQIQQAAAGLGGANLPAFNSLQDRFGALVQQLQSGAISLDQFRNETALLTAEIDKATAAERRAMMLRLLQGKGTAQDMAALQQMQQAAWLANFDQQLEGTFNQFFGLGQAAQTVGSQFINLNTGMQNFGNQLNGFFAGGGGGGGPVGSDFWGGLNDLFNSTQGQIDLLYNNIQLLYQSLYYKDDAERWQVLDQIRDLEQQLVDLQTSPPPTFVGTSADSFFKDPGLQTQTNNTTIILPGIENLDSNGIRHLADRLEDEWSRRGRTF